MNIQILNIIKKTHLLNSQPQHVSEQTLLILQVRFLWVHSILHNKLTTKNYLLFSGKCNLNQSSISLTFTNQTTGENSVWRSSRHQPWVLNPIYTIGLTSTASIWEALCPTFDAPLPNSPTHLSAMRSKMHTVMLWTYRKAQNTTLQENQPAIDVVEVVMEVETINSGKTTTENNDSKVTMINETTMVETLIEIESIKTHAWSAMTMIIKAWWATNDYPTSRDQDSCLSAKIISCVN